MAPQLDFTTNGGARKNGKRATGNKQPASRNQMSVLDVFHRSGTTLLLIKLRVGHDALYE
jgi:hypothetical protein